ncbi:MAG: hypothetical protein KIT86_23185 [Hydrogenophaga sp.]|uniref:hypothetical protein n=1 Tax=Hydrogenophaga sp. TaxID=1904254 RepID=UPI00262A122D|nr:hypothetical protein [Hydrogenophaga sp.]MCW5672572.1 hypothetical protein [Hydrogenophaga sp.]
MWESVWDRIDIALILAADGVALAGAVSGFSIALVDVLRFLMLLRIFRLVKLLNSIKRCCGSARTCE